MAGRLIQVIVGALFISFSACGGGGSHEHFHGGHPAVELEDKKGPHGGRLLSDGDFSLELQIFEKDVPPHFRAYAYEHTKQLGAEDFSVTVALRRLGGGEEEFALGPAGTFRANEKEVREPHSFDVQVSAEHRGSRYVWKYQSYEARTEIPDEIAVRSGVTTERVGGHEVVTAIHARGKILPSEDRIAHVIPRFSGVVREGRKHIGDRVEKGEVMAVIESNQNLQPFEVKSQISGTVINGHLIVGEFVPDSQWVYVVADLSEVWADFSVSLEDSYSIASAQDVLVSSANGDRAARGRVSYIAPYADERAQTQLVRVVLPNEKNAFLPGMFVSGDIVIDRAQASVAVKKEAVQRLREWEVVFVKIGETYEARPLTIGKRNGEWVEVIAGLSGGDEYVVGNAFLIKADILKSGASHDH